MWCSPPCTDFSLATSTAPRGFALGDSVVIACFDINQYLTSNSDKHVFWVVENPHTGFLSKREHKLQWAPHLKRADCCKYGIHGYQATQ